MNAEVDVTIQCPFCYEHISIRVDVTAGETQEFVYDCEVCCRPIDIRVRQRKTGQVEVETGY